MKPFRFLFLPGCVAGLLLAGCPTDPRRDTSDSLRSPITFRIDPAESDHPFCDNPDQTPFASAEECRGASKYLIRWEPPEDTVDFSEYRIYVDTMPPNDPEGRPWSQIRRERSFANFLMATPARPVDSILFVVADSGKLQNIAHRDTSRIYALDTTARIDASGRLVFAIMAAYGESGRPGLPRYTFIITDDRFPPQPLLPDFTPKSHSIEVNWTRPLDPTSFFDPGADSGIIQRYTLRVVRGGVLHTNRPPEVFRPRATYSAGGVDRSPEILADSITVRQAPGWRFQLPDSQRVFSRDGGDFRDSLKVVIDSLTPMDTVDISLWATDSSGNATDSVAFTRVLLTDTTRPVTPLLRIQPGTVTRNGFVYAFTASRDLVETPGGLAPADAPNANIMEYRLSRRHIGGSTGGSPDRDSILRITASNRGDTLFIDTVLHLPPGAEYRIHVQAVDSTGHLSERDSIDVATPETAFAGSDSGATCPPGFIPMPAGDFRLGDTVTAAGSDERPAGFSPAVPRHIGSYCIEPYEHHDTVTGRFTNRVTWQQAHDICAALDPAHNTRLCTEAEWERACEGTQSPALQYGIQSERRNPSEVRLRCNVGIGDSIMALERAERDPTCISHDGAFDMAGNLAEWVLDPYDTLSYLNAGDTLTPGEPLTALSPGARRGYRGYHYLNPMQPPSTILNHARCSNRDYPVQPRPQPHPGCVDSTGPQLVVVYDTKPPRCFPLPDSLAHEDIVSVSPVADSSRIFILLEGVEDPVAYRLPPDTAYAEPGLRPSDALLSPLSLAVVTFENTETLETITDTLDATEIRNASGEAALAAIFAREASPPWSVRKENGQYAIRYLYAYTRTRGVPSKPYYSNSAIGFRCCSDPVPPP